jgi:ABC-type amino acid transport substrate-binding protein
MSDDRLRRWLEAADRPERPSPEFASALLDEIGHELGFGDAVPVRTVAGAGVKGRRRVTAHRPGRSLDLLLVAAFTLAAAGGLIAVTGALRERVAVRPPAHGIAAIREAGRIRIAIRPEQPQFTVNGQPATGFDSDVASEIGRRLGVTTELVIEHPESMQQLSDGGAWDIALPSVPSWTIDQGSFVLSAPYYRWPHFLIVPNTSGASSASDVSAGPVCAVTGDAGEAWLRGNYGAPAASPMTGTIISRATDAECLVAMSSREAVAAVTADLSAADLQVRSDIRPIGGPAPEPRVVIAPGQVTDADSSGLIQAVDDVLAKMRADGTLSRFSESRFGGADLTVN